MSRLSLTTNRIYDGNSSANAVVFKGSGAIEISLKNWIDDYLGTISSPFVIANATATSLFVQFTSDGSNNADGTF